MVRSHGRRAGAASRRSFTADELFTDSLTIRQGRGILGTPIHHISYESGLADEEIARVSLAADEVLEVWRLDARLKGGGSNADVTFDVYDVTNSTVLASATAGSSTTGGTSPIGSSSPGSTVLVRVTTGSNAVDACLSGVSSVVDG